MGHVTGPYDALLLVSFGGPEGPDDVMPFLRNVTRGRGVPDDRLAEVAGHYDDRGGVSPINQQNRDLLAALRVELDSHGIGLPLYWGNRNWHPLLGDTVREMRDDGVQRALAFVTSAFSSYSSSLSFFSSPLTSAVRPPCPDQYMKTSSPGRVSIPCMDISGEITNEPPPNFDIAA